MEDGGWRRRRSGSTREERERAKEEIRRCGEDVMRCGEGRRQEERKGDERWRTGLAMEGGMEESFMKNC